MSKWSSITFTLQNEVFSLFLFIWYCFIFRSHTHHFYLYFRFLLSYCIFLLSFCLFFYQLCPDISIIFQHFSWTYSITKIRMWVAWRSRFMIRNDSFSFGILTGYLLSCIFLHQLQFILILFFDYFDLIIQIAAFKVNLHENYNKNSKENKHDECDSCCHQPGNRVIVENHLAHWEVQIAHDHEEVLD